MNAIVDAVRDFVQTTAQTYQSAVQPRIDALGEAFGQMVEDAVVSGVQSLASDPLVTPSTPTCFQAPSPRLCWRR
jgi:hypothetical protein